MGGQGMPDAGPSRQTGSQARIMAMSTQGGIPVNTLPGHRCTGMHASCDHIGMYMYRYASMQAGVRVTHA